MPSPSQIWRIVRAAKPRVVPVSAGHSAVGTLSVYALLIVLAVQVSTGVFTNDGSFTEGPWVKFVSEALSNRLSRIHYYNHWAIAGLTLLHVTAIAYYSLARKEDLLTPMLTGDKLGIDAPAAQDDTSIRVRATVLAALACGIVFYLVTL
jgi:cytochrome b